jgi:hypothetical protein
MDFMILVAKRCSSAAGPRSATYPCKALRATLAKSAAGDGVYTANITRESLDLDGEVLIPRGCDPAHFNALRTVFWNHRYDSPIAKAVSNVRIYSDLIQSDYRFAVRPATHVGEWFPDTVKWLVDCDVVRGVSVGHRVIERRAPLASDRQRYGDGLVSIVSRWKLLEWSIAPLQCNGDAVARAEARGVEVPGSVKRLFTRLCFKSADGQLHTEYC